MLVGKKIAMQMSFGSKKMQILHHVLDPKMGVEKWTQKWCQNLTTKTGSKSGAPKMGSKNGTQKGAQYLDQEEIKTLFTFEPLFGVQFLHPILGCHFWTPFWWSNSGAIFGSIFQPPFWGPKHGAKFAIFCCQSSSA